MNKTEFETHCNQLIPLVTGNITEREAVVSALEELVNNQELQSPEDVKGQLKRKYILVCATPGTDAYQNLHRVLSKHPKAVQVYNGIANLWAAEARVAQSHYETEDELFRQNARGYFPSTPYERWFVTATDKEVGGLVNKKQREGMRANYLQYCKEREAEYRSAAQ